MFTLRWVPSVVPSVLPQLEGRVPVRCPWIPWTLADSGGHDATTRGPQCLESQPSAKRPEFVSWYVHTSCVALDRSVLSLCLIFLVHLMRW